MSQKPVEILIADDDQNNRALLRTIFEHRANVKLVGEAGSGPELLNLAPRLKPQVVFISIEMPDMDGMAAARKLMEKDEDIIVVFMAGQPDAAVEAFEISSFDYILKPFSNDRIEKTLDKISACLAERDHDRQKLANVFKSADKLYIKSGHELHFINIDSIYYVEKDRKRTVIHTTDNKFDTHESINDLERRLDKTNFFRSHKCYLINLKMVEKIIPWGDNSHLVKFFKSNKDALIARSKVKVLYELLEIGSEN